MLCKTLGLPKNDDAKQRAAVVRLRKQGVGILKIAREVGAGTSYVQRIDRACGLFGLCRAGPMATSPGHLVRGALGAQRKAPNREQPRND
jgi:hypothetical protein